MTVSQRSRFITPKAIRKISDRTEGALTRRTRHRGIKTAKKLIKGPVWEQCRSLPRIYPSLWRTSTGTVQMPAGVAPTDSPALNFLSSALATAAVLNLGDAKPDLHRQFDDLGAGGGGQGGLQFHSHRTSDAVTVLKKPRNFALLRLFRRGSGRLCRSACSEGWKTVGTQHTYAPLGLQTAVTRLLGSGTMEQRSQVSCSSPTHTAHCPDADPR